VAVALACLVACVLLFVAAAAKIFRVGLLMQGKNAGFGEMIRWALSARRDAGG